jgi:hypothetical protein
MNKPFRKLEPIPQGEFLDEGRLTAATPGAATNQEQVYSDLVDRIFRTCDTRHE